MDAVACGPCHLAVAVEAVDGNDTWKQELESAGGAKGHYGVSTHSTTGSTPSATTSRPWGHGLSGAVAEVEAIAVSLAAGVLADASLDGGRFEERDRLRSLEGISRDSGDGRDEDMVLRALECLNGNRRRRYCNRVPA